MEQHNIEMTEGSVGEPFAGTNDYQHATDHSQSRMPRTARRSWEMDNGSLSCNYTAERGTKELLGLRDISLGQVTLEPTSLASRDLRLRATLSNKLLDWAVSKMLSQVFPFLEDFCIVGCQFFVLDRVIENTNFTITQCTKLRSILSMLIALTARYFVATYICSFYNKQR